MTDLPPEVFPPAEMNDADISLDEGAIACIDFETAQTKSGKETIGRSINRRKTGLAFDYKSSLTEKVSMEEKRAREREELDDKYGLPETWTRTSQVRTKSDQCAICDQAFTLVAVMGVGSREFSCKQCGLSVCGPCSSNKRFLAKNSTEKLRVCDLCDTKLDNIKLRNQFDKFLQLKKEKVQVMQTVIEARKQHIQAEQKRAADAEQELRDELERLSQRLVIEEKNEKLFTDYIEMLRSHKPPVE